MSELSRETIVGALTCAQFLLRKHQDWTLERAIAEATTTAQCQGVQGFRVFAGVRAAIRLSEGMSGEALAELAQNSSGTRALKILDDAIAAAS
jgi:hypothetical protein